MKTGFITGLALSMAAQLCTAVDATAQQQERRQSAEQCRQRIERVTRDVLRQRGRDTVVTSRHRDNSAAHRRGALDIRSRGLTPPQRHAEARELSRRLPGHNVIVEEVHGRRQTDTTYRDGVRGRQRTGAQRATGTHTHIQPDRDRCREAVRGGRGATSAR